MGRLALLSPHLSLNFMPILQTYFSGGANVTMVI